MLMRTLMSPLANCLAAAAISFSGAVSRRLEMTETGMAISKVKQPVIRSIAVNRLHSCQTALISAAAKTNPLCSPAR